MIMKMNSTKKMCYAFFFSLVLPCTSFDFSLWLFFPLSIGEKMLAIHLLTTY